MAFPIPTHDDMVSFETNKNCIKGTLQDILTSAEEGPEGIYVDIASSVKDIYVMLDIVLALQAQASFFMGTEAAREAREEMDTDIAEAEADFNARIQAEIFKGRTYEEAKNIVEYEDEVPVLPPNDFDAVALYPAATRDARTGE
jgi:hypothetical protein